MSVRKRMAIAGTLAGIFILAAVGVVRGKAASADSAGGASFDPLFPSFGDAPFYDIGGPMQVNGGGMRIAYFSTRGSPADVARFYQTYWNAQNLRVEGQQDAHRVQLTAFDTRAGVARSLTVFEQGQRVLGLCAVSDLKPSTPTPETDELAVPASARLVTRAHTDDSTSVSYLADQPASVHERDLVGALQGQGWRLKDEETRRSARGVTLQFIKGAERAVAALFEDPSTHLLGVQIHRLPAVAP